MESMLIPREKAAVGKLVLKGLRAGFKKFFPEQTKKLEKARTDPELQKDFESELTYNQLLKERDPSILEDPNITPSRREYLENNTEEEIKKSDKKLNKMITQMEKTGTGVGKSTEKPVVKQLQKLLIEPSEGQEVVKQIMQEGDNKAAYDIAFDKVGDTVALSSVAYALGTAEDDILGYLKDNNVDYDISKEGENTVINVLDSETEETSLSKKEYEKIINNTEEDVSIIEAKDTDKEFSMATDNPTKYVFMKDNMPFYKTKDGVKALNLKTGEEGVDLALVPFRTKYSKAGKVLNLIEAITGKKIKDKKNKMVSEAKAQQELESILSKNPQGLDNLTVDEEMELMSLLPQRTQAQLGLGEEPLDDIVEMARGMKPEEVAKNLELFSSIDDIFEYAGSLDAKDARKFITNLSDEDKMIFEGELPDIESTLTPRVIKAEGSLIGGQKELDKDGDGDIDGNDFAALRENKAHGSLSILMTPEMMPVDTYPNMSPEEEKAAKKSQLPDEEMEDNYIDFVMDESLSEMNKII